MGRNELRAVVATSTLDLGIDWGDVDLVVHVGAPRARARLAQRNRPQPITAWTSPAGRS